MTQDALKLSFAPGDYSVAWQLPLGTGERSDVHGILTVRANSRPKGTAHGNPQGFRQWPTGKPDFPQCVDAPQVTGRLANGANVLLINARITYWPQMQAAITADAAIITFADVTSVKPVFNKVEVQVSGLDAIAGTTPLKRNSAPGDLTGKWLIELNPEMTQQWKDSSSSVKLSFNGAARTSSPYDFVASFSPTVHIEFLTPLSLRELLDNWITPILNIVSTVTGRAEELTYATVYQPDWNHHKLKGQLFGTGITQQPYKTSEKDVYEVNAPLQLKQDEVSLLDMVRIWQSMAAAHHPLIETYGSMIHARDQHPRSRFLLLLQAIEGAHGHETKTDFLERAEVHKAVREELIETINAWSDKTELLDKDQLKFLKSHLSKQPPRGLEDAINWLDKKLPGDIRGQLGATRLITAKKSEPSGNGPSTLGALRVIRNHLTHGTKGYDSHDLNQIVRVLDLTVRAQLLDQLGCPETVLKRTLRLDRAPAPHHS